MRTLYLLSPHSRNNPATQHKDFYTIEASGIGPDYGISSSLMSSVANGMPVVVFDRDRALQARGVLGAYEPTVNAGNSVQRYDVTIHNLQRERYSNPPRVNRFGVAVY